MEIFPPKKIKIAPSKGRGRGVFATEDIKKGEIIEYCPIINITKKETDFLEKEDLTLEYYYLWQEEFDKSCVMFGYGSIYNHDKKNPNAELDYDTKKQQNYIIYRAIKNIKAGEEIVWDYDFVDGKEQFLKLDKDGQLQQKKARNR